MYQQETRVSKHPRLESSGQQSLLIVPLQATRHHSPGLEPVPTSSFQVAYAFTLASLRVVLHFLCCIAGSRTRVVLCALQLFLELLQRQR